MPPRLPALGRSRVAPGRRHGGPLALVSGRSRCNGWATSRSALSADFRPRAGAGPRTRAGLPARSRSHDRQPRGNPVGRSGLQVRRGGRRYLLCLPGTPSDGRAAAGARVRPPQPGNNHALDYGRRAGRRRLGPWVGAVSPTPACRARSRRWRSRPFGWHSSASRPTRSMPICSTSPPRRHWYAGPASGPRWSS